jgi:hypothetical protein
MAAMPVTASPAPAKPAAGAPAPAAFQEDEPAAVHKWTTIAAGALALLTWTTAGLLIASYLQFL